MTHDFEDPPDGETETPADIGVKAGGNVADTESLAAFKNSDTTTRRYHAIAFQAGTP